MINFKYIIKYGFIDIEQKGFVDLEGLTIDMNFNISKNASKINFSLNSLIFDYDYLKLNFGDYYDKKILAFLTQNLISFIWPLIETEISSSLESKLQEVTLNKKISCIFIL